MQVKIQKDILLKAVKDNLVKHKEIVDEAFAKYREQVIKELDGMIADAKAGKRIRRSVQLVEPVDQTKEYQKAIRQIEMSAEDTIRLEDNEFDCLVLDNWSWKANFSASNRHYTDKIR